MRSRRPRTSKEETREQIMLKAEELFRQYGYGKTTVADIAAGLGMSTANIYKFFPSRDAIIETSAERNVAKIQASVCAVVEGKGAALAKIEKMSLAIFRFHKESFHNEQQIYKLVVQALDQNWACVHTYHDFLNAVALRLVKEGMANGEFRKGNATDAAQNVLDCLSLVIHPHLRHDHNYEATEERVKAHVRFIGRALQ